MNKMEYKECSSCTNQGVDEVFQFIYDLAILYRFQVTKDMILNFNDFTEAGNPLLYSEIAATEEDNRDAQMKINFEKVYSRSNSNQNERKFTPKHKR